MDKDTVLKDAAMQSLFFESVLNELPTIEKSAKNPLRRQHMLRMMFKLAMGAGTNDLTEGISDVTRRTLENDLAYLRRHGILRSKPGKKGVRKWGRPSNGTERNPGRPPTKYWLMNAHDLITSDLVNHEERRELIFFERRLAALPEFKQRLERELEAAILIVKMTPRIIEALRPFRKIPEFKNLFKNLPPSDEVQIDYSPIDAIIPGELVDQVLVRTRISIPGESFMPFEAAFRLTL